MRIQRIKINNVLGVEHYEFEAGAFNSITGRNGEGKTSVLEAVKAATQCGHDATLLRKGATEGEIVLVLDDGSEIQRRITADGSKTDLYRDGRKQPRAVSAVQALTDALSVNPIEFLRAPKKDRARILLESMPIEVDVGRLAEISGVEVEAEAEAGGLALIEMVAKQVYDNRTGTNRAVKEKDATINQLTAAMPAAPGGVDGDENELQASIDAADAARDAETQRVDTKLDGIEQQHRAAADTAKEAAQAEIDRIREALDAKLYEMNTKLAAFRAAASRQRELAITQHAETVQPLRSALAAIRANRDAAGRRQATLATIETMREELAGLQKDALQQTQALADIEAYKLSLLASLPIPGLAVVDGDIQRDGVPFDRLNTAQQVDIAVAIAKLRAGDLGVICIDGIELLDTASFESFRERAIKTGLQLFVTRVSDGAFGVEVAG